MRSYKFSEVTAFSGATQSNLIHWLHEGLIKPDIADTSGTGRHRHFSFRNIAEACIAERLNWFGWPVREIEFALLRVRYEDGLDALGADGPARYRQLRRDRTDGSSDVMGALIEDALVTMVPPTGHQPWAAFTNPQTRDAAACFFLWISREHRVPHVIDESRMHDLVFDCDACIVVNLRSVLEDLEEATDDYWSVPGHADTPAMQAV